ncbi:hypothetical protein D6C90_02696 [Aureobasidium pullulans]|uniref:Uncharacterized protein n=1 Tax=Aureobasidium pullulans TaxID=5580 RepID=A0A4S9VEQ8_AURPU|nr:hypothetical protein D6C90_02696 [Aureobasidium pullulans]
MTAEFAPTAGIMKVLVAGVASSRKVQAINTAYGLAVDKTVEKYEEYEQTVVNSKARRMYRMMIGSRSSHIGWDDFNVDIVDFLSGGPFENQPAQMKLCKEQWDSDLSTEIEIASKKKKQVTVKRNGTIGRFVTECEAIAAADPVYRARFGLGFHCRDDKHDKDDEEKEAMANPEVLAKLTMTPEQHRSCMELIRKGDLDV